MYHQGNIITTQPLAVESSWSRCDDCLFLKALVTVPEGSAERWEMIAAGVPGKTAEEVKARYAALEHEVIEIESGRVPLPSYHDDKKVPTVRKKGTPWTQEEHRRFLEGLIRYGKGDWRAISRNSVITRTATQVASHAQKYYIRQALVAQRKEKKRSSIHDITTTDTTIVVQQQPIPQPQPISFYSGEGGGRIEGTRSSIHDITTMVVQQQPPPQPQPISCYSGQGGGRIEGTRSPQMGYAYQPNFVHPY